MFRGGTTLQLSGDPRAALLRNTARILKDECDLAIELELVQDAPGGGSAHLLRHLRETLAALSGSAGGSTRETLESLRPLTSAALDDDSGVATLLQDVRRFARDLVHLAILDAEGLDGVNDRLRTLLAQLRARHADAGQISVAAGELNDLLRRAIYLFPDYASCVTLTIRPDDASAAERIERYVGRSTANRDELRTLWRAAGGPCNGDCMLIRLPLPYVFSPLTSGGERQARRESWDDVSFLPSWQVTRMDVRGATHERRAQFTTDLPPLVLIRTAFDGDLGLGRFAIFTVQEVDSIMFTKEDACLPARAAKFRSGAPEPRLDAVTHYLVFRDFGDIGQNPRLARALDIPALATGSLFAPEYSTGLLDIADDESGRQWLEHGFGYLGLLGSPHPSATLLRFDGVELRADQSSRRTALHSALQRELYCAALEPIHPFRAAAAEFRGAEIVAELLRVPVARRHFREC
jgi:hypothetical protein